MAVSIQYLYLKLKPIFSGLRLLRPIEMMTQSGYEFPDDCRPVLEHLIVLPEEREENSSIPANQSCLLAAETLSIDQERKELTVDGMCFRKENCPMLVFFSDTWSRGEAPVPILLVPAATNHFQLYREILNVLFENDRWQLDVSRALLSESKPEELLRLTFRLINMPMYFADASFMTLTTYGEIHPVDNSVLVYQLQHGYLPFQNLMKMIHTGELTRINESPRALCIRHSRCFKLPYIAKVIHRGSLVQGYFVIVESGHGFTQYEIEIADRLGDILSEAPAALVPWLQTEKYLYENFLLDIMNGGLENRGDIQRQLNEFGWNSEDDYRVMVLSVSKSDVLISHNLISVFSAEWDARGFTYKDLIVLVYHDPEPYFAELKQKLPLMFRTYRVRGAMSEEFSDFTQVKLFFREAVWTLLHSNRAPEEESLQLFENYYLFYRAQQISKRMPVCNAVKKICRYDQENETEYGHTLYEYLLSGGNVITAAKSLFLHRNTMNYRMKKLQELFGLDLEDPQVRERCLDSLELMMRELPDGSGT